MQLALHNIVFALSSALDLVGIDEVHHGKRVALMSAKVAEQMDWDEQTQLHLLYAGMLHDCGVSKTSEHRKLVGELDWQGSQAHCLRGYHYLNSCPPLSIYAEWIRYHHTHWQQLQNTELDDLVKHCANLLFMTDRVDFLQAAWIGFDGKKDILCEKGRIVEEIQKYVGTLFAPELFAAFAEIAQSEAFWLIMDSNYIDQSVHNYAQIATPIKLESQELLSIIHLFSRIIDAKSPFTEEHSIKVAKVARFLAEQYPFSASELDQMEIAGLLHDIGKLRVPDAILEKNGPLTVAERAAISRHSFDTYQMLQRIFPQTNIPHWAGFHHENLTGHGYPFRKKSDDIDLGARIVSVADCFQALAQNRPYRGRLSIDQVMSIINEMVQNGKLDNGVVGVLTRHQDYCYQLAISP